jgi:hypothetical protein
MMMMHGGAPHYRQAPLAPLTPPPQAPQEIETISISIGLGNDRSSSIVRAPAAAADGRVRRRPL